MSLKKLLTVIFAATFAFGLGCDSALSQGKGGGGGGGKSDPGETGISGIPARFSFSANQSVLPVVTSDGLGLPAPGDYVTDADAGANVVIMASGNPDIEMRGDISNPDHRTLFVQLNPEDGSSGEAGCHAPADFGEIQGNGTLNVGAGIRVWFNDLWEQVSEGGPGGAWLDLTEGGDPRYGHLVIRFQTFDDALGVVTWYLNFGGNYNGNSPGSERVEVQRMANPNPGEEGYPLWRVTGVRNEAGLLLSKAKVTKGYVVETRKNRTATVTEDLGLCSAHIDFDIVQLAVPGG